MLSYNLFYVGVGNVQEYKIESCRFVFVICNMTENYIYTYIYIQNFIFSDLCVDWWKFCCEG